VGRGSVEEGAGTADVGELREMARFFHALRDALRLRVLLTLAERGEMTVTGLARALRVSQPLVSFHLRPLRLLGLVKLRRAGRAVYYTADVGEMERRQAEFIEMLKEAAASGS
jgi:DNA-binding transcriptional ArsR family regulator